MKHTSASLSEGKPSISATPFKKETSFNKGDFVIYGSFISFLWRPLPF